jgi:Arc/MetJ-type ribon-helix-helix transcriptional regulator
MAPAPSGRLREALRELEERAQRDEALLRQALEALEEARNALYEALAKLEEK